jgi:hypothetical protein
VHRLASGKGLLYKKGINVAAFAALSTSLSMC